MELVAQYRESLMKIVPRMTELRDYAWLGGHGIQENGCEERRQQYYLAGGSRYFNPIRPKVVLDMVQMCIRDRDCTDWAVPPLPNGGQLWQRQ